MRILNIKRNEAPGLQCQRLLFIWIYIGNYVWSTYRVGLVIFPSKRMALDCPSTTAKKNGRLKASCRGTPASGVFSRTSAPPDISNTTLLTTCRGNTEPVNGDDHSTQSVESESWPLISSPGRPWRGLPCWVGWTLPRSPGVWLQFRDSCLSVGPACHWSTTRRIVGGTAPTNWVDGHKGYSI